MGNSTAIAEKFTSADLALMPDDGKRYEIIDGELYVSRQPAFEHQYTCSRLDQFLGQWNDESNLGAVVQAPGLIFGRHDDVAPDIVWISRERLSNALDEARHLTIAPELVIEVLSSGKANQERDREVKLNLYSRRGVDEELKVDRDVSGGEHRRVPEQFFGVEVADERDRQQRH